MTNTDHVRSVKYAPRRNSDVDIVSLHQKPWTGRYATFVKEFRAAPIPPEWKKDDEIRNMYYNSLDSASEPWKQQAKGAMEICLGYSVKYQYYDNYSRVCEVWLAENYKSEYHLIDEFRGSPTRVNSALREQAYPLLIGGEPLIMKAKEPDATAKKTEPATTEKAK